ncbi:MAG: hypothetical protein M1825_005955 [Sarcosagium campestre]|nr:MAG: hypothetical protein M1825_005955 [Sarcosagium campestre]
MAIISYMALFLLSLQPFLTFTVAFDCTIQPIYIDIHKRAVHGTDDFEYGTFIGVGTPAQNQSLWVSLNHNETSVADQDYCNHSTLANCSSATGGFFEPDQSTSWKDTATRDSVDEDSEATDDGIYGEDKVHLYTHFFQTEPASEHVVDGMPVRVSMNGTSSPGRLGMGWASTILEKLYAQNLIASRSYSLFLGSGSDRQGGVVNGSITLGGYDASRFTGTVHNYSIVPGGSSPLRVRVAQVSLDDDSGKNQSLLGSGDFSSGFDAELSTEQYPMSLPFDVTENFKDAAGAEESNHPDGSLRLKSPFNGTLTIVLDDGFSVTLPADVMSNATGLSPVGARTKKDRAPFVLSSAWLSQVYLMVDYDSRAFHLAQAVPEAPFISMRTTCPKVVPQAYGISASKSPFSKAGLSGVVVGSVVGGLGAIALCIWIGVAFMRWRLRRSQAREIARRADESKSEFYFPEPPRIALSKQKWRKASTR